MCIWYLNIQKADRVAEGHCVYYSFSFSLCLMLNYVMLYELCDDFAIGCVLYVCVFVCVRAPAVQRSTI